MEQNQQLEINISKEDETINYISRKIDTILEKSPNSIRNFFRRRKIDVATINNKNNPLLKAIEEGRPLPMIHALMKNFSSIRPKKHITKTDIEMVKLELQANKQLIEILNGNNLEALKHFLENESFNLNFFKNGNNPLIYAIRNGKSYKIIEYLLQNNMEINFNEFKGSSPLTEAAILNNKEIFELLLRKGANVNHLNYLRETPLLYLVRCDIINQYYLSKFIEHNVNLNLKDKEHNTVLMYLTQNNEELLVKFILDHIIYSNNLIINLITLRKNKVKIGKEEFNTLINEGYSKINVDAHDKRLNTSLMFACQESSRPIVSTLLTYKADINKENYIGNSPLFFSCYYNDVDVSKLLLSTGKVDIDHKNKNGDTALCVACQSDNEELINLLIDYHCNLNAINNKGQQPIHIASIYDKLETLKTLCKRGADLFTENKIGNQCFSLACINDNTNIIDFLLTFPIDINHTNYSGDSALHQCCILQKLNIIKKIITLDNLQLDEQNGYGFTPFLIACKKNDLELAKLILNQKKPINIDVHTNSGDYALFYATYYKNYELLDLLFEYNVDMYNERLAKQYICYTAFLIACGEYGNEELIKYFINKGIDVNRPNSMEVYPLYEACKSEKIEHVELLLKNGANPNVQPNSITPLIQACIDNNLTIVDTLVKGGANINFETVEGIHPLIHLASDEEKRNCKIIQYLIGKLANLYCKNNSGNDLLYIVKNSNKVDKEEVYETLVNAYKDRNDYQNRCADTTKFIETYDTYKRVMNELNEDIESNTLSHVKAIQQKFTPNELDHAYLQACINGKDDEVKYLLEHFPSININVRETNGDTPLIIACQTGSAEIALYLLEHGAETNYICECSNTALYVATFSYNRHNNINLMRSLLDHGANLNLLCQYRLSPLMVAAKDALEEITELFLEYGADLNIQDSDGNTALSMACIRNNQIIVDVLLKNDKVNLNLSTIDQFTPLMISCNNRFLQIASKLIEVGADITLKNNYHQTAFHLACYRNFMEIYDLFLNHTNKIDLLDEDDYGFSPYFMIKINGNTKYFEKVIDYEMDYIIKLISLYDYESQKDLPEDAINYLGKEAYNTFDDTKDKHQDIIKSLQKKLEYIMVEKMSVHLYLQLQDKLLTSPIDLKMYDYKGINMLFIYAIIYLDVKIVYHLFNVMKDHSDLHIDLNATDQDGNTALHYICSSECIKWDTIISIIKFLLKQPGINVNAQNNKGYTPLMLACYKHNETVAQLLIQHGVDVNISTYKKVTPLMMACQNRSFILVDLLIKHGAQVDVQNDLNSDTALIIVSRFYYSYNIIKKLLVDGKANPNICNKDNETALTHSCNSNNIEHIKLLVENGADINVQEGKKGLTPLMIVLGNFDYYIGEYFIKHHADLSLRNHKGETALVYCCQLYNKYGAELLIEHGADINIPDNEGQTAKSIIENNNFNFVIGL